MQKNFFVVLGIVVLAFMLFLNSASSDGPFGRSERPLISVTYSEFVSSIKKGDVHDVLVYSDRGMAQAMLRSGIMVTSSVPEGSATIEKLSDLGANVRVVHPEATNPFVSILMAMLPMLFFVMFWFWMMRRLQGSAGGVAGLMKSKAKKFDPMRSTVKFSDVAGVDEAKAELQEVVEFLRNPVHFSRLGGRIPKGVLLVGPPGTGKTMLVKAVAHEAGVPFFSASGSDFVEMFVGMGAGRVRSMFAEGRQHAPCIIFIDEIDAMGRKRGSGVGGGNDEREQTLNQMLVEMDGFEPNEGVIIIAATNRPDVLDPALLRPGRFDREVHVSNPDVEGRTRILEVHGGKVKLAPNVDMRIVARGTPGFSGADLANLVNEAALLAGRHRREEVSLQDIEAAKDRILMGTERRSMKQRDEDRRLTAYHEAGHAYMGCEPGCDPVHKATIVPRGRSLGLVQSLPEHDRTNWSRKRSNAYLAMCMGGRAAEIIVFGEDELTSGGSSDIVQATRFATLMVSEWGFSDLVGPVSHAPQDGSWPRNPEQESSLVNQEIKRFIDEAQAMALRRLREGMSCVEAIAQALLERETLDGNQIRTLAAGGSLEPLPLRVATVYAGSVPATSPTAVLPAMPSLPDMLGFPAIPPVDLLPK